MNESVRLDRWLWAARFFQTRALASAAIGGGKVHVNGARAKAAKQVRPGDALRIRVGPYEWLVTVRGLSERRGPAQAAQALYEESPEGRAARARPAPTPTDQGKGRPTKKDRRKLELLEPDVS